MQITIELTEAIISKMEVYRAGNIKSLERLMVTRPDDKAKEYIKGRIVHYRSLSTQALIEKYLS